MVITITPYERYITMKDNHCLKVIEVGEGSLNAVAWSPDGTRLAVGDKNNGVSIWTTEGKMIWRRAEHTKNVRSIAWSSDGQRLVSGSEDSTIRIWDAETGEFLLHCEGHNAIVFTLGWSPDGQKIAWNSSKDILQITDPDTGASILECSGHTDWIECVAWSPSGKWLASGSDDNTIRLWDTETGECINILEGHRNVIRGICFSSDGRCIASASEDNTIRVWNVDKGECRFSCEGHTKYVSSVSWSPVVDVIASASWDGSIRLWSMETELELAYLQGHSMALNSVSFSSDGSRLASVSDDNTLRIWDASDFLPKQALIAKYTEVEDYITRQVATVGRRAVIVTAKPLWPNLEGAEGDCLGVLKTNQRGGPEPGVAIFPSSCSVAYTSFDGRVRAWNLNTGKVLWKCNEQHDRSPNDVSVSFNGKYIATGSNDNSVKIWDSATGICRIRCKHRSEVLKVAWSPVSNFLFASASSDCTVKIWNAKTGKCLHQFEHISRVWWVEWSPDGQFLATGDEDRQNIRIWFASTGLLLHQWRAHRITTTVTWSPDGRILASGGKDKKICLWDTETWKCIRSWSAHSESASGLDCLHWSPDGRFLASGSYGYGTGNGIYIWEATTGQQAAHFKYEGEGSNDVWRISWSPDEAFLAASYDGDIFRFWDTRRFAERRTPVPKPQKTGPMPSNLAFLPSAFYQLHRLNIHPPLSLLRDLLNLTGGNNPNSLPDSLKPHPGLRALANLRWPTPSRIGLTALLLRNGPLATGHAPPDQTPSDTREHQETPQCGGPIPL
ncbi:MAG: hypothetical protein GY765_41470, partial [bacterium]|nr:hypothetical protein [bacterium]